MDEVYHIFFHDDVDGIVGAALFLHNHVNEKYRLYPLSSSWRGDKFNYVISSVVKKKDDKKVIIDYQYHKQADIWIDHHFDANFGDCEIRNKKIYYSPKSPSATKLIHEYSLDYVKKIDYDFSFLPHVDIIDSASYKSIDQVFFDKSPMMILRAYLEKVSPSEMTYCRIVEVIAKCHMNVKMALYILRIGSYYVADLEKSALKIKSCMIMSNKISIVNQRRINQFPRFSEFFVERDLKYCIRFTTIGNGEINLQIGYNPWCKEENDINIGKIVSEVDYVSGGGHYNVAGGVVVEKNVDKFIDYISSKLNGEEPDMEKYAVDKSDPVEKQAEELIKVGKAENISEARKKSVEKLKQAEDVDGNN